MVYGLVFSTITTYVKYMYYICICICPCLGHIMPVPCYAMHISPMPCQSQDQELKLALVYVLNIYARTRKHHSQPFMSQYSMSMKNFKWLYVLTNVLYLKI
jgi:hypothetical protein